MRYAFALILLPLVFILALSIASCSAPPLGLQGGQLLPCPGSPNCVSSFRLSSLD